MTWSRLVPNCPVCGLGLERGEQGYWLGAYFFNLMAVETVFTVWFVGFLVWTWPTPPWELFQITTIVLMLIVPVAFFPYSKTLFLAFDLLDAPPQRKISSSRTRRLDRSAGRNEAGIQSQTIPGHWPSLSLTASRSTAHY